MSDEAKSYPPSAEFVSKANVKGMQEYRRLYQEAETDPELFWANLAKTELTWFAPFVKTLEWESPKASWFLDGKLNACYNCVDRHLKTHRRTKPAIIWEG